MSFEFYSLTIPYLGEKVLVCSVCKKKFTTKQALLHHVVVHTGEKPFQCAVCGNKFTQPANLRTHVKKRHAYNCESNKTNKCEYCGEPHVSIVGLHQHLLEDHPQQVQEEREILAKEKAERHQEKERKEREKEERRMKREQQGHRVRKPKKKEWELDFEFYIGDGLVRGVDWDRTPSNGEIGCGQCERKFGWRFEIMFHGLCHLLDDQGNARNKICPECDTTFKVPIGLKHHLITHTGETPFLCLHCWKSFSSHIDLKLHIKKEHLMHLNSRTGKEGAEKEGRKRERRESEEEDIEESTSHYVQLEDGTYAEMVEGHEIVAPGEQMLVEDEDGQKLVVVNPKRGRGQQTVVIPRQAETVYVIASRDEDNTIIPDSNSIRKLIGDKDGIEMIVEDSTTEKYIRLDEI
ncbi:GDNF-inducible zinc finger protein 1 [Eurytemora carolleeae]|uniref:GDNF-inducible zinc finger protein 1 n=1 Tax=Eurytemora carolleeae TaxID=1294199 RepID=UPI000C771395|nr:GDNF-inducible zinc finger protein 1 [Eurytemora carolleeae]|eukprot:XP_023321493.1 GDNF-inducible zinc finger protein 1-like [Eurytemora affinis]